MTLGAKSAEVCASRFRALARIRTHRRIERVKIQLLGGRDIKSAAKKGLKDVREGDAADVDKSRNHKINFTI